jgi:hypothetical protein
MVGLWFSLVCQTSLRAIVWTLFTILIVVVSCLVLPLYSSSLIHYLGPDDWLYRLNMGLAPPVVLGRMLPFGWDARLPGIGRKQSWEMQFALLGLGLWATAGVVLWFVTSWKLGLTTGRQIRRLPEELSQPSEPEEHSAGVVCDSAAASSPPSGSRSPGGIPDRLPKRHG